MRHSAESLRRELADAFAARGHPGEDHIALVRDGCAGYEGNEAGEWLRGKTWQQLISEGMGFEHRDYVNFLRPEGWLYFFPAFATFALDLDHPTEMHDTLLVKLAWSPRDVASLLAPQERRAVVHLLEYLSDALDERGYQNLASYALEAHWCESQDERVAEDVATDAPPRHDSETLQAEIQAAFAAREYPGDDHIGDTARFGEYADEAGNWLRGKTWREMLAESTRVEQSHLLTPLLPEAWLYYFPAFATLALESEHRAKLNALLVKLTWFPQELEPFLEPVERLAIVHFLEHWADAYVHGRYDSDLPRYALTIHWAKPRGDKPGHQENRNALS